MQTIFGNSMATRNFAKDSSAALGIEDGGTETDDVPAHDVSDGSTIPDNHGATSSASKTNKRARIAEIEDDGLISAFKSVGENIANAIKMATKPENELPTDLFDQLKSLPGFDKTHISFYFAYLVANPHIGKAFYLLPFEHKLDWVAMFISERFPVQ